jgi:hypothetical protein
MNAIYLTAPLALEAPAASDQLPRTFSGLAYSGGVIDEWGERIVIDLDSTAFESEMPLLFQHRHDSMIGAITVVGRESDGLHVSGELFSDIDEDAASIAKKAQRGARYQMSVGLYEPRVERLDKPEQSVTVNGRVFTGPGVVLRDGLVREVSIVALGADRQTNAQFFSAGSPRPSTPEDSTMPDPNPDLQARIDALQAQVADLSVQLQAASDRAAAAEKALADERTAARTFAVKQLFAELGREAADEAIRPYVALSAEAFDAVARDLRAMKPRAGEHLFQEQATGEPGGAPLAKLLSASDIYAQRRIS